MLVVQRVVVIWKRFQKVKFEEKWIFRLESSPGFSLFTLSERRLSPAEAEVSSDVSEAPVTAEDGESGPFGINRTSFDISFELLFDMKGYLLLVEISSASGT